VFAPARAEQTNRQRQHSVCVPRDYNEIYKPAQKGASTLRAVIDIKRSAARIRGVAPLKESNFAYSSISR
jgi:hypothetical protein